MGHVQRGSLKILESPGKTEVAGLLTLSQTFTRKARLFHDKILRSGKITWDSRGVITIDGRTIPQSNITDLINLAKTPPLTIGKYSATLCTK
ncbi:hypothetical protein J437_LFUL018585 [Ladona fulva]|uniref:Uncharacterized protein n=1 Tax=Ladona fulva TaxID=123851 RepID=A0A8K0PBF4_LADFU|nr:hypothetical protein J437_LFUL018585 [Ladona fulva]